MDRELEMFLQEIGVVEPRSLDQDLDDKVVRDFSFKMPELDENGEPPF
jgi:hypothetical protein